MILVTMKMTVLPAKRQEFMQTVQALIQSIRKEKGCMKCAACRDIADENTFRLIEEWKTQQDLDNHLKSDLFDVLLGTKNFMSEPLEGISYTVLSTSRIAAVEKANGKLK